MTNLIDYRAHGHSQSGEEGVIARVMSVLGKATGLCCEFGAWDGIHLSNTRALMERGWRGLMIEADPAKHADLLRTYPAGSNAVSVCAYVDADENSLAKLSKRAGLTARFDLISIDIDGLDYEAFSSLDQFTEPPLVVCIEAHTCHRADDTAPVPRDVALRGCGQPLGRFIARGKEMGYRLICFIGTNAIFLHDDAGQHAELPTLDGREAAAQNFELIMPSKEAREFLYLANLGLQEPLYRFDNPMFSREALGISHLNAAALRARAAVRQFARSQLRPRSPGPA